MRSIAIILVTLVAGCIANPGITVFGSAQDLSRNERIVTGQIVDMIDDVSRRIVEAGLDPMERDVDAAYELPVPVLLSVNAIVENFKLTGLSNIVVQNINFSILQSRLTFVIVLPAISASVDKSDGKAIIFGEEYTGAIRGSLSINTIRVSGDVRVNISIISGISIRSLAINFSVGGIASNLDINILGRDLTGWVNTLLGTTIPGKLNAFERDINQLIEIVALDIVNGVLESRFF